MSKIFYQILVDVLPKLWGTIKIENVSVDYSVEIIHVLSSDYLSVCLVNTNKGTPFISALELRPLKNNTYITQHWLAGTTSAAGCWFHIKWYVH